MKPKRSYFMIASILVMAIIWLFIALEKGTSILQGIDLYIFILIIGLAVYFLVQAKKKDNEREEGFEIEDEMSNLIKYKAGHDAFVKSSYVWLFIFIFRGYFPNVESMIGGGVLISAAIFFFLKWQIKRKLNEE